MKPRDATVCVIGILGLCLIVSVIGRDLRGGIGGTVRDLAAAAHSARAPARSESARATARMDAPVIEIITPDEGATVGMRAVVEGLIRLDDLGDREPVVVVQPQLDGGYWIQPLPGIERVAEGYRFRGVAHFGTQTLGRGESFAIRVLLVPAGTLQEGQRVSGLPAGVVASPPVVVVRGR